MINELVQKLLAARSVVLSTHRNCDGDGIGSQLALLHGLKKLGKSVRILNVDLPAKKYQFLKTEKWIQAYDRTHDELQPTDLALILDTNDWRLVEPLFGELRKKCGEVLFIDHHPILKTGPEPTAGSWIDVDAASTGELCYRLLKALFTERNLEFDSEISRALYTSIVFDTQLFRYVRSAPNSHLIAADLLKFERHPEEVHHHLFATYTVEKMVFLTRALAGIEYRAEGKLAFIRLDREALRGLQPDDSADVIDMVMNIESIEIAALLREDGPGEFKLSLRSKGRVPVLPVAESFGGGGHRNAAGAYIKNAGDFGILREELLTALEKSLRTHE